MKTYGIICEYNPFHNGHIRLIEEARKQGATHIVAVMSGNYVQRGDVAIIDKFKRAQIAVNNGVDLVIEMPVVYSLASAEMFARAGVMMLGALGCVDGIAFGSECGDLDLLKNAATATFTAATPEKLKPLLEQGLSFPQALQQAVLAEYGPIIAGVFDSPNNTLAVEYLRSIKVLGLDIEPFTLKRSDVGHDSSETTDTIASGSKLREMIEDEEDISAFVPADMAEAVEEYRKSENLAYFDNLERELLYILRTIGPQQAIEIPDVAQGLENRILQAGRTANSIDEFFDLVDTKRYTLAKFRRILLNLFIGIRKADLQVPPTFGRILAFNERGTEIIKKTGEKEPGKYSIPFASGLKEIIDMKVPQIIRNAELTCRSSDVYTLASRNIRPSASDFTTQVAIQKTAE